MTRQSEQVDVLIIGARVAGSSLALLLGKMGKKVLLVDRDRFPSDTLSTHHIGHMQFLNRLGILSDVEALGLRRLTRFRNYIGDCVIEGPHSQYALVPRRKHLDQIVINHALRNETVHFWEQTQAEELIVENSQVVGARLKTAAGEQCEVRAQYVVGADGKNSKVAAWVGAEKYNEVPALRSLLYAYYQGIRPLEEPATEFFFQDECMGAIFPMEPGFDCLAIEMEQEEFESFRKNPVASFAERFKQFYGMEKRMENAVLAGGVKGTPGVENYFRKPYGPGWVLTGDAAYCKDPSTGLGINDAFLQSLLLAESFERIFSSGNWEETMSAYQLKRDAAVMPTYQATLGFTQKPPCLANTEALLKVLMSMPTLVSQWAPKLPEMMRESVPLSGMLERAEKMAQIGFGYIPSTNE